MVAHRISTFYRISGNGIIFVCPTFWLTTTFLKIVKDPETWEGSRCGLTPTGLNSQLLNSAQIHNHFLGKILLSNPPPLESTLWPEKNIVWLIKWALPRYCLKCPTYAFYLYWSHRPNLPKKFYDNMINGNLSMFGKNSLSLLLTFLKHDILPLFSRVRFQP